MLGQNYSDQLLLQIIEVIITYIFLRKKYVVTKTQTTIITHTIGGI